MFIYDEALLSETDIITLFPTVYLANEHEWNWLYEPRPNEISNESENDPSRLINASYTSLRSGPELVGCTSS